MKIAGVATALVSVVLTVGGLTACGSADESIASDCVPKDNFSTVEKGKLTVGVTDMPPQVTTQGEGGMSGIDADIIRLFAKAECLPIEVQPGNSAAVIPAVQKGRSDVALGGWNRTQERAKVVGLSDPLYVDPLAIISADGTDTIAALEGRTVGTVDGYNYVPGLKQVFGDNLKLYPTPLNMAQDLDAGRIQAAIDGAIAATVTYDTNAFKIAIAKPDDRVPATVKASQGALVFNIDNHEILGAFNRFLAEIKQDGQLKTIVEEHKVDPGVLDTGEPRLI